MGITGLIPFMEKASRRANVSEFSGCTVAIDSYCWLHKGAFACAERLVRGEDTDMHIKYCLKYVTMLLSKNIKPILVFDGRHLPAKAITESKRRESRDISKKRAAELLSLGKIEEARSYMRRSVDITHAMALALIKECRKRNVDCIVAPYEADAQLAYLNIRNIAHLVITEDSDLILFGCTKVLFKMDLDGTGTLVDASKLALAMKCPIEHYSFDKFRQMCIMSGCDYLASLPGIGLAKARQFVTATQDSNFANALRKLPSFFNKSSLTVTDEYRESFLKAEATFKYQYVYDPLEKKMVRLTDPDDEDIEEALCVNAGKLLDPETAFQLALGNLDPFSLKKMDDWHPDIGITDSNVKTNSWKEQGVSSHASIWKGDYSEFLKESKPWSKKVKKIEPIISAPQTRQRKKVVNLVAKIVPETQDESLTIESLSSMYGVGSATKKQKLNCDNNQSQTYTQIDHDIAVLEDEIVKELPSSQPSKSPILENRDRSFKKTLNSYSVFKRLSKFPRTILGDNVVESKFFNTSTSSNLSENDSTSTSDVNKRIIIEESPERVSKNPFKLKSPFDKALEIDTQCIEIPNSLLENSQKENSPLNSPIKKEKSPILNPVSKNPFKLKSPCDKALEIDTQCIEIPNSLLENSQKENSPLNSPIKKERSPILNPIPKVRNSLKVKMELVQNVCDKLLEDSVIDNTYPLEELVTPVDSQISYGSSPPKPRHQWASSQPRQSQSIDKRKFSANSFKSSCKVPGLKRSASLPSNQPTLLSKFGFQKKPALKR